VFNFLVSSNSEAWNGEPYTYERSRVFEYTEDAIVSRFNELREDQLERLCTLPSVFAYESGREMDARVGQITSIRLRNREVVVHYRMDGNVAPIPHQMLLDRKRALDIGDWELNRTHWAVKDVDLIAFLEAQGLVVCDFTMQNPNVFYEAGIAHTLGKPVIPITQDIDALPFDLKHRRALVYSTTLPLADCRRRNPRPPILSLTRTRFAVSRQSPAKRNCGWRSTSLGTSGASFFTRRSGTWWSGTFPARRASWARLAPARPSLRCIVRRVQ